MFGTVAAVVLAASYGEAATITGTVTGPDGAPVRAAGAPPGRGAPVRPPAGRGQPVRPGQSAAGGAGASKQRGAPVRPGQAPRMLAGCRDGLGR